MLVVEDDPVAADAHRTYVERVPGFTVVGVAHSGAEAQRALERFPVDLLLLDLYLPDGHGLQLARSLRAAGHRADVIAVTSARDLAVVREGVSLGVVQYVLKPFTFATLRDRLARYAQFRTAAGEASGQAEVDRARDRSAAPPAPPRGWPAATPRAAPPPPSGSGRSAGSSRRYAARTPVPPRPGPAPRPAPRPARAPRRTTAPRP
ncbi:response regulator [Streptomyces albidoflavus]|uniref:response regulator n=1 Tax=Streptomyces albidoflavus TaxID=1886 RepID=UPI0038CF980D